jgi:hypothetical protein
MYATKLPPWVEADLPPRGDTSLLPRGRYKAIFGRCPELRSDKQRALAVMLLSEHRSTLTTETSDGSRVGKRIAGRGQQLAKADDQRFASVERVDRERARFEAVMDVVRSRGPWVWATFTLPRECADSPVDSYMVLTDALTRFYTRCETDPMDETKPSRPGERPAFVAVTDAQRKSGWAHRHVLYPERARLYEAPAGDGEWKEWVRAEWADLNGAPPDVEPQVSLETVRSDNRFKEVRDYARKPYARLRTLASMDRDELQALAERLESDTAVDRDRTLAALTTMWPDERRVWGVSDDLRSEAGMGTQTVDYDSDRSCMTGVTPRKNRAITAAPTSG